MGSRGSRSLSHSTVSDSGRRNECQLSGVRTSGAHDPREVRVFLTAKGAPVPGRVLAETLGYGSGQLYLDSRPAFLWRLARDGSRVTSGDIRTRNAARLAEFLSNEDLDTFGLRQVLDSNARITLALPRRDIFITGRQR